MFLTRQWLNVALCGVAFGAMTLTGCSDRPPEVPSTAQLTTQGRDRIVYTADRDGTVWVADKDTHKIVYSTHVHQGDRVDVDSTRDEVRLNDRVVMNTQLHNNPHNIFFQPGFYDTTVGGALPREAAYNRPREISGPATLVGEGRNKIQFTADRDGTVWVADRDRDRIIYSGRVMRGDTVAIDNDKELIAINGNRVNPRIAYDHVDHRVYFQPMEGSAAAVPAVTVVPGGASLSRPADVPAVATLRVTSAEPIEFTPDLDGTAWVVTNLDNRVIYTGRLIHGDHLIVNPSANVMTLNGRSIYDRALPHDQYRVYFLASAR